MAEKPYANREIDEKFKNLDSLIREKHDDQMVKIGELIVQTTKTNGKVRNLQIWRAYTLGFCGAVSLLLLPVLFMIANKFI